MHHDSALRCEDVGTVGWVSVLAYESFELCFFKLVSGAHAVKDMWVGRELIDDLSSGSMPDLYTAVGGECGAVDLQHGLSSTYHVPAHHACVGRK